MLGLLVLLAAALALLMALLTAMLAYEMRHPPRRTLAYALANGLPADPGELGLGFEEWTLELPHDIRLPVWDISAEGTEAANARSKSNIHDENPLTAILVHGWGHSRFNMLQRVRFFARFCRRIVLYDQRGHGDATGTSRLGCGEQLDLLALLERLDDQRIVLVGHSMGAVIAINAVAHATRQNHRVVDRVVGIIAYGAYCDFHHSLRGRLRVAGYPARPISDLALMVHRCMGVRPLNVLPQDLQTIRCPILFIHGSRDRVSAIEHVRSVSAESALCVLHEIEDAEHTDTHLREQDHDEIVREFLLKCALKA